MSDTPKWFNTREIPHDTGETPETDARVAEIDDRWHRDFKAFDLLLEHSRKLERERDQWKADCLEQCKLLAMSADREEKLRTDLALARKLADSAMLEADRLRAQLHKP